MISLSPEPTVELQRRRSEATNEPNGSPIPSLETTFAEHCGTEHAIAVSDSTTALRAAFEALDLGRGDYVLTTPFSSVQSANAIRRCGATPVFADIDPKTYTLDARNVAHVLRYSDRGFAALLVTHTYGLPAEMNRLMELATADGLAVIEDGTQSYGATYGGKPVGSFGDVACFSLPSPTDPATDAGVLVTDESTLAERATRFRDSVRNDEGTVRLRVDLDSCESSPLAETGDIRVAQRLECIQKRRSNATQLTDRLQSVPVTTPVEPANAHHIYRRYTIRCSNRDGLRRHLSSVGIESAVRPASCVHNRPTYEECCAFAPIAEQTATEVLSLPVHSGLSDTDVDAIADAVTTFDDF